MSTQLSSPPAVAARERRAAPSWINRVVLLLLLVGFYYNAYRYPFQINSTDTSPTYHNTPAWLSAGKYVLVVLILVAGVLWRLRSQRTLFIARPLELAAFVYLAIFPVVSGIARQSPQLIQLGFFFVVPVAFALFSGAVVRIEKINRLLLTTVWIAIATQALQVALFFLVGRLPALAYEDSISVRFGSFLDDPNGFGLLLSWLVPFAMFYLCGIRRVVALIGLVLCAILTQSLTAVATLFVIAAVVTLLYSARETRAIFRVLIGSLVVVVVAGLVMARFARPIAQALDLFLALKAGSIQQHLGAVTVVQSTGVLSLLGLQPRTDIWGESGYLNLLVDFGVPYVLVLLLVGAAGVWRYARLFVDRSAGRSERAFAAGGLGLLLGFYLASVNLPLLQVFPINFFTALLLGLASAGLPGCVDGPAGR